MEKNRSSLIPDVNGIYSDVEFLNYMSDQVSWSDNKSSVQLRDLRVFFWSEDRLIELKKKGNEPIKEKIKSALGSLDFHYMPTLVQFWASNEVGCPQFLETSEFPFGISPLRRGLCWYRKKCLNYKYRVDGENNEEEYGPVGRVFRNGFPEFSPDVSHYSAKEYKLRDFAVTCGVKGYLALPVFESGGQHCVGVLELISVFDGSFCLTDKIGKVDDTLKAVGLMSSKICSPFDMEWSSQHESALTEIKKILEAACCTHKLPFAQAWFYSKEKNCSGDFLCTSEKGSYLLAKSVRSFQKECMRLCLKKGKSVVWTALGSGTSCFCRDIKQLRISEYSLVNIARKFDLTSCFAICLQRKGSGSDVYVLEFFLSSVKLIDREPQAFLGSLLAMVKKHSQSFKVTSGLELGAELSVEVIKLSTDNEVDSFRIHPAPRSPEVPQNQVKSFYAGNAGGNWHGKERNRSQITMKEHEKVAGESSASGSSTTLKDVRKRKADDDIKVLPNKRNTGHSPSRQENVQGTKSHIVEFHQTNLTQPAIHIETPIVIKAVHEENIIKFQFPLTAGIKDFESEVEKRLELKAGSYRINHLNDDNSKISLASDADLQNFMRTIASLKKTPVKLRLEPIKIQHIETCSNPVAHPLPQTSELQNKTPMFIKVTHNDDTIKFQLSLSAGMMEFKDEVMKRIKLTSNSFGIKYRDEENEWIPIASDTHLQSYMSKMRSKEIGMVRFYIDPITH